MRRGFKAVSKRRNDSHRSGLPGPECDFLGRGINGATRVGPLGAGIEPAPSGRLPRLRRRSRLRPELQA
jgi:hypothetical protein